MILFRKVRWKNIFSYGNSWTEIQLDRSPSTMVTGSNGSGKSTLLDAITFCLFGKPFRRINKSQLVNTKNGSGLLVEMEFEIGDDAFVVRRGIRPDIFEIRRNGHLINQDGRSRDYQATLERILGFDYNTFTQIVVVGKATHVSFMKLDPARRRLFVENILNLVVFSNMNRLHAARLSEMKRKFVEVKSACEVTADKIKVRQRYISDLIEQAQQQRETQSAALEEKLRLEEAACERILSELGALELKSDLPDLNAIRDVFYDLQTAARNAQDAIDRGEALLAKPMQKHCSHCGQEILPETAERHRQEIQKTIDAARLRLDEVTSKLAEQKALLDEAEQEHAAAREIASKASTLQVLLDTHRVAANRILDEIERIKTSTDHFAAIEEAKAEVQKIIDLNKQLVAKRQKMAAEIDALNVIGAMLKDSGIKASIIKRFIPIINYSINQNLSKLGFFAKFTLDENFDETIQARGIDTLSYNNFSEGEKLRIDMAILLAWREIAKMHNNVNTNLLIFDEVMDASMDDTGTEALATLLSELKNSNVFIVTHSPNKIRDFVRSSISFHRKNGFSRMES